VPQGRYWFNAVRPKFYPIPDDGPVGKMLARMGRHPFRPAHLHYIIEADGFETLTTHTFDPDDPYIHSDAVFGVKESLIAQYKDTTPDSSYQKQWEVEFDFVLARS
jgi:catechol 1,2-dioxygenase